MIDTFVPFVFAVIALLIIPGPDMAFVIANGMAYGKSGAFFSSLGISSGGLILALATALLVGSAASVSPIWLLSIQTFGCLYLLYVAITTIIPESKNNNEEQLCTPSKGNLFIRGIITNVSNPKALLFFSSFIPQFIPETSSNPATFAFILGCLLCLIGLVINFLIGMTGTAFSGLNKVAFYRRTFSQWIVFVLFLCISIVFTFQTLTT